VNDTSSALARNNLGVTNELGGRLEEAVACYAEAAALRPEWPDPHANLGNALRKLGRIGEGELHLRRALSLNPRHARAHNFLGIVCYHTDRLADATAEFRRALELRPNDAETLNNLGMALTRLGDASGAVKAFREVLKLRHDACAHSALIFTMHYDPHVSRREIFDEHVAWAKRYADPLKGQIAFPENRSMCEPRRLRLGYVSADFREHTRSRFVEPVLANHDHTAFEVFCYSDVRSPDEVTARLRSMADVWRETGELSDEKLADMIRLDKIDILVELTGHMAGNRLLTFARQPAPVQVAYPGYPNTTGLSTVGYCLTDADRDPPGSESFYTERLVRLGPTSQCYQPTDQDLAVGPPPQERTGVITFASLNKAIKINPAVVRTWASILRLVERSKLLLLVNPGGEQRLIDQFSLEGIGASRVELVTRLPRRAYLALHSRIDINLDPWPYNGHTTLLDGLWMGVPAVVLAGDAHVSREGAAVMKLVGLSDLVAGAPEDYALRAVRLACDRPWLTEIRARLRNRMRMSPLMNGAGLVRGIETAYQRMWHAYTSAWIASKRQ
jgi:predicted O-linked N-acetylglucosamine transferase (SPINDLY family)